MKLIEIEDQIAVARAAAIKEARQGGYRTVQSRGTFLHTVDDNGQCAPHPEAECPVWRGTLREINQLIRRVEQDYPNVIRVCIGGGYDGCHCPNELWDGGYDPWVSSWDVDVWTRPGATV